MDSKRGYGRPGQEKTDHVDLSPKLRKIYDMVEKFLSMEECDEELQQELNVACPDYKEILLASKRDLKSLDCEIFVTGETKAGITSLINRIIKHEKLFVTSSTAPSRKVCRIRNSENLSLTPNSKSGFRAKEPAADIQALKKSIRRYTGRKNCPEDVLFVDVYLPVPILKGDLFIVDTPGIVANTDVDQMLFDLLPQAVSFIFVISAETAGRIHKNQLSEILQKIKENETKMPCFDPNDVLFVINKCDLIENDSSDEEESDDDDEQKGKPTDKMIWQDVFDKLTNEWRPFPRKRMFLLTMKQVAKTDKEEKSEIDFTMEYKNFEDMLRKTIEKNQNKKLNIYFNFLETFIQKTRSVIEAREETLRASNNEKEKTIKKQREQIQKIEKECIARKQELLKYIDVLITQLAYNLYWYIDSTDGKREILSPAGKSGIMTVYYYDLDNEIPKRLQEGIKNWCRGDECKRLIEETSNKIEECIIQIQNQISVIHVETTGKPLSLPYFLSLGAVSASFLLNLFLGNLARLFTMSILLCVAPAMHLYDLVVSNEQRMAKIYDIYSHCLSQISVDRLQKIFADSVGKKYTKIVMDIFDGEIAKQIDELKKEIEDLLNQQSEIRKKLDSMEKLKKEIKAISEATYDFRKKFYSGVY